MTPEKYSSKRSPIVLALSVVFATALCGLSGEAAAAPVTASSNLAGGTYVNSATSGNFNISGALAGNTAVSGSVTATFFDDGDSLQYNFTNTGPYVYQGTSGPYQGSSYCCGISTCYNTYTDYYYERQVTQYWTNPFEQATLSVGSSSGSASSNFFDLGLFYNGTSYNGSSFYGAGYNYYSENLYTDSNGYNGGFSLTLLLDAAALADINSDGILGFSLGALGDYRVSSITLTADLTQNQDVPEPGSLALLGLALGGLGVMRRRSSRKSIATF